jgi:hypothetical protein
MVPCYQDGGDGPVPFNAAFSALLSRMARRSSSAIFVCFRRSLDFGVRLGREVQDNSSPGGFQWFLSLQNRSIQTSGS